MFMLSYIDYPVALYVSTVCRLKDETGSLSKEKDHVQNKLERNVIYQQYLEKVLETAEEVSPVASCIL